MPRLFAALEIPTDIVRSLSRLRGLAGARWIDEENFHITLRFFGDVDDPVAGEIVSELRLVRRHDFQLSLAGLGVFGSSKPRAVWVGVGPEPALQDLHGDLERRMQRIGLQSERRKFTPHVTVARLRGIAPYDVADYLALHGDFRTLPFAVTRFVLMSARSSRGGGPYVVEDTFPLGP